LSDGTRLRPIDIIEKTFGRNFPLQTIELKELIQRKMREKFGVSRALQIEQDWEVMPVVMHRRPGRRAEIEPVARSEEAIFRRSKRWSKRVLGEIQKPFSRKER
jgi:hypothetical protein